MILGQEQAQRYARHFVLKEIGVSGQKKLLQSGVLVIGAGALGSAAIIYLAAAGVGTMGIADYDEVEFSNLQRQVIHKTDRTGMKKTVSAELSVKELNPDINVRLHNEKITADNITDIIAMYDFVIDCTDRFETKFLINDACVLAKKPYSHAGVVRFEGQAMTYVPKKGPCLRCLLGSVPPPQETMTCSQAGVLGAVTGIVGSVQALEAVKYLIGAGDLLTGRLFTIDGLNMVSKVTAIPHSDPDCAVCGNTPSILSLNDNKEEYEVKSCSF
ncbi:MAG: HesA/MoeB/ThiF family protein [Clostridia bacterium]|nr:HesA/MoeB/ThiF family protein [Clostridia bacterium]